MDNIEQTLERLIANWDQLHMNGTDAWIVERRKLAEVLTKMRPYR